MNGLALCAGIGGLEVGLELAIPGYRTVGYVERDSYAAAVLVARMESAHLDRAPIHSDLESFPSGLYRLRVDIITAGFPCQPFSVAGSRLGTRDRRWVWPHITRIIGDVVPRYVFLENVPGILARHGGMGHVMGDLAELGFDAEWGVFSAAQVGAPHLRKRVFILATHPDRRGRQSQRLSDQRQQQRTPRDQLDRRNRAAPDTGRPLLEGGQSTPSTGGWWEAEPDVGRVVDGLAHRVVCDRDG